MARNNSNGSGDQGLETETAPKLTLAQRMLVAMPTVRRGGKAEPDEVQVEAAPAPPPARAGKAAGLVQAEPSAEGVAEETATAEGTAGEQVAEGPKSFREKLKDAALKPPDKSAPPTGSARFKAMSDEELVGYSKRIDDKERLVGFFAAPIGAALGVLYTVLLVKNNPALGHKNHLSSTTIIWLGGVYLIFPVLTLVASFIRKRGFLAAMFLLMAVSFMGVDPLFFLPFAGGGIWLFVHSYRMSKELQARGLGPQRFSPQASGGARGARPTGRGRKGVQAAAEPGARPRPSAANKRYTPPKPQPRKPVAPKSTKES